MRVLVWPADEGGCGHYRATWPARALADQGADVDLLAPQTYAPADVLLRDDDVQGRRVTRALELRGQVDADVVVVQRPLAAHRADVVELLQAQGVRVVVEIDDDFETIHPRNSSFSSTHPRLNPGWNREHLARACRRADLVTVTTPTLGDRYGRHGRVVVVPNHVPAWYLEVPHPDGPTVGWTGSTETHPTDLQVTRGAVGRCTEAVQVVGTGTGVAVALGVQRVEAAGWLPLDTYPAAMAQHGIGLVPLDDIAFNHSKSALKMMEYASLGVPVVASPTSDNVRMHKEGIGLVAPKPKHWAAHLRALIGSPEYRLDMSATGREIMARWTIEGNTDRWMDAWASAITRKVSA